MRMPTSGPGMDTTMTAAFPASLRNETRVVLEAMPPARLTTVSSFSVSLDGESVTIPYRLYNEPLGVAEGGLSPTQQLVLHCLYSRHHDGRVRHRHLEQLLGSTQPWVIPFVVQLVGEYVLEILVTIQRELVELDTPGTSRHTAYGQFLTENLDFLVLTGQRMTSYWNCYYRSQYPDRRSYPGYTLLTSLQTAASAFTKQSDRLTHRAT